MLDPRGSLKQVGVMEFVVKLDLGQSRPGSSHGQRTGLFKSRDVTRALNSGIRDGFCPMSLIQLSTSHHNSAGSRGQIVRKTRLTISNIHIIQFVNSAMSGRNPFSSREIGQLVIYIAQYYPVPAGRLGNNLYKSLVDDVSTTL